MLVHGAFADASCWNGVIELLQAKDLQVTAPSNPLRGIAADAAYIAAVLEQIEGPVLAVGHSYGGAVITNAGTDAKNVVGLVYVAAQAPKRARPWRSRGRFEGQRPEQRAHPSAIPHCGRRIGDGVLHRPGEGPRRLRGRPLRPADRTDRSHPAAHLRVRLLRAVGRACVEGPAVDSVRSARASTHPERCPSRLVIHPRGIVLGVYGLIAFITGAETFAGGIAASCARESNVLAREAAPAAQRWNRRPIQRPSDWTERSESWSSNAGLR
jgi:pimeloyl-ACP methyl ester carboxylesterase